MVQPKDYAYYAIHLLDHEFDHYEECEINDMVNAAKSGVASTANENLYSLPKGKYYENTWIKNRRIKEKLEKERDQWLAENPPITFGTPNPQQIALGLSSKSFEILSGFADNPHNKKLFKKYAKS